MKKVIFSVAALALFVCSAAVTYAYNSPVGSDPKNSNFDVEYKYVVKSAVAGESSSIAKGDVLLYASALDGYTVVRVGGGNNVAAQHKVACVAAEDIATGDLGYHRCVTRGYIDYLKYNATIPFTAFNPVCVNAEGVVEGCTLAVTDAQNLSGTATAAGGRIIPMQTKSSGTGSNLKAIINIP